MRDYNTNLLISFESLVSETVIFNEIYILIVYKFYINHIFKH